MTSETDFIAALRQLTLHEGARGLQDDAAVLEFGDECLIITHDMMVEGRHWLPGQDMADVAWKLVAVNLSDLAAKGAEPLGVVLGHTLGDGDARFIEGLRNVLGEFGVPLLGGDTVANAGPRTLGCTAIGRATCHPVPSRSGAQAGDSLWITGPVGAAMLGYEAMRDQADRDSTAYRRPTPLLAEGRALAPHVSAMMDVSDGLLLDSFRLACASDVTIRLETDRIPVADADRHAECLRWGDDYQLLFAAPEDADLPVSAFRIGQVRAAGPDRLLIDGEASGPPEALGYLHR